MVDQTQVGNGRPSETPTRGVARSAGELLQDMITLGELQVRLFFADARAGVGSLVAPIVIIIAGTCVLLGCIEDEQYEKENKEY